MPKAPVQQLTTIPVCQGFLEFSGGGSAVLSKVGLPAHKGYRQEPFAVKGSMPNPMALRLKEFHRPGAFCVERS